MLTDFHMHSIYSDGVLIPSEILQRLTVKGFEVVAITDHADNSNIEEILKKLIKVKNDFEEEITFLPGVELTHVPPKLIPALAKKAKEEDFLVVVHGETIVEPVREGTNIAAVSCPDVDILAHPGLITEKEIQLAKDNDVFLELSARKWHCLGNGRLALLNKNYRAKLLVNSDSHTPSDFLDQLMIKKVILGSGLNDDDIIEICEKNSRELIKRF